MTDKLHEWCAQTGIALTWQEKKVADPPAEIQWEAELYHGSTLLLTRRGRSKKLARQVVATYFLEHLKEFDKQLRQPVVYVEAKVDPQHDCLTVTSDAHMVEAWLAVATDSVYGLDCEFYQTHLATIQIASATAGLVYALRPGTEVASRLKQWLEDAKTTKYMVDPAGDRACLAKLGIQLQGEVDVRTLVPEGYVRTMGLNKLSEIFLHLPPKDDLATSNWLEWPLSARQVSYAITDAIRSRALGMYLSSQQ